jgi:hypothetical protein
LDGSYFEVVREVVRWVVRLEMREGGEEKRNSQRSFYIGRPRYIVSGNVL